MNAVGIDVSKGKSMVAILRPFGEIVYSPFGIKHTFHDINSLVDLIHSINGESRVAMEYTGHYYEVLAHQLSRTDIFVRTINPKLIKDFDNDSLITSSIRIIYTYLSDRPAQCGGLILIPFCNLYKIFKVLSI